MPPRSRTTAFRLHRGPPPAPEPEVLDRTLTAAERFRGVDDYRVGREWRRYEGTAQREMFRALRERFLRRHSAPSGWTMDLGSGPGRFTPYVGGADTRRLAIELALPMLHGLRAHWPAAVDRPELVLADGLEMPVRPGTLSETAVLGNAIGFAGTDAFRLLDAAVACVRPGGHLLLETAPGPGTSSRYLRRLPSGAMVRLLRAPLAAVLPRVTREGFEVLERDDKSRHGFRPVSETELTQHLTERGFAVTEAIAVAPALGDFPERLEAVRAEPGVWDRLLALEERLGSLPVARREAAALLVAAERPTTATPAAVGRGIK